MVEEMAASTLKSTPLLIYSKCKYSPNTAKQVALNICVFRAKISHYFGFETKNRANPKKREIFFFIFFKSSVKRGTKSGKRIKGDESCFIPYLIPFSSCYGLT